MKRAILALLFAGSLFAAGTVCTQSTPLTQPLAQESDHMCECGKPGTNCEYLFDRDDAGKLVQTGEVWRCKECFAKYSKD